MKSTDQGATWQKLETGTKRDLLSVALPDRRRSASPSATSAR